MEPRKKLLFVINTMGCGGAETALLNLLETPGIHEKYDIDLFVLTGQGELVSRLPACVHLLNRQFDPMSVLSAGGTLKLYGKVLRALCVPRGCGRRLAYLRRQSLASWRNGKAFWQAMAEQAERFDTEYDLAIAFIEGGATYYVANYVRARRKVAFVHVDYSEAGYSRRLDDGCYDRIDSIFTVSDEVRQAFQAIYPEYRVSVFHNKLDCSLVRRRAKAFRAFEDGYDGFRLLTVGRLVPQKALEVSIDAMSLLKEHGVKARWYVLGEGPERRRLERLIRKRGLEGDFLLLGARDNPYPFFDQADLYVHASRFEGKSIAVQEAQILGKAVIVSDCSGNREQVISGVDGVVTHFSAASLCYHIEKMLREPALCEEYGRRASARVAQDECDLWALLRAIG